MLRWKYSRPFFLGILIFLMAIPLLPMDFFRSAGLQQTLAVALLYGALALSYDLLFGYTGLLSFGHALFFASGAYVSVILINTAGWNLYAATLGALIFTVILALMVGSAALRTSGIAFAMVTLAFGEAGHVIINRNVGGWTNAENGLPLNAERIPSIFVGVSNTHYIYWLAIGILSLTYAVVWWVTESPAGRVFAALRDNEMRVSVLGLNGTRFKLLAFTIAASLASVIGVGMLIASGSAAPRYAEANTTIALLLMVILGGAISRWGAVLGGVIYSIAQTRLQDLTQSGFLDGLPKFIGGPLEEPVFILGLIFILVVMFSPGGISGAYYRLRMRYLSNKSVSNSVKP
jgi:branched-chain amino acid transport system permease protein